jgi:hypothetical protein
MKKNKFCQSCGMPFSGDPKGGGSEKDGAKSDMYCSYCFKDGLFLSPEITDPKQMQILCIEKMKEKGMNGILAWILTRGIPRLERWK